MVFVPFVEPRRNPFYLFWSCNEAHCFWQGFTKWVAENQIKLKSDIFTPDIIFGLSSDTLSNTKQYFYFLAARYYIWTYSSAKQSKYFQK